MFHIVRLAPIAAVAIAAPIVFIRAWIALTGGHDVNLVSGVWLALAFDLQQGVFYRPLVEDGYYGGTRYFPLLFLLIAGGLRAGLPVLAAGQLAGFISGAILASGAYALLTRLSVDRPLAAGGALLTVAPYFVVESIFAIRAEPLAAGLVLWGASFVMVCMQRSRTSGWVLPSAICFTLAVAAKPTAVYAPVAAVLALGWAGRQRDGVRLALLSAAGLATLMAGIWLASDGRAIDAFRTGALAGEAPWSLFGPLIRLEAVRLVLASHYLTATLVLVAGAMIFSPRHAVALPGLLAVTASLAAAVALATPGTILTNQGVEPYAASAVFLVWAAHARTGLRPVGHLAVAGLLLWAAAYNGRVLTTLIREDVATRATAERTALLTAAAQCSGTWLSESPLLPVLAGHRPLLLDPFAFRVAALKRPALAEDLVTRLRHREFGCVVLEMDPESDPGRGWYANVHLGAPVIDALLEHYAYQESVAGRRFYVAVDGAKP